MTTYTKQLKHASRAGIQIEGGKAASLGELTKHGFSVPNGFVITLQMFRDFLEANNLNETIKECLTLAKNDEKALLNIADKIRKLIFAGSLTQKMENEIFHMFNGLQTTYVAVRSSANVEDAMTSTWAGQFDSFLNIKKGDLINSIKKCWASLYSDRALSYQIKRNNTCELEMAVIVQEMIFGDVSGLTFSAHPFLNNKNQIIIESVLGLGPKLVSGIATPDRFVLEKSKFIVIDQSQTDYSLTKKQLKSLWQITKDVENAMGCACDIEWTIANDHIWLLQSRPITTLLDRDKPNCGIWQELENSELLFTVTEEYWLPFYLESSVVPGQYGEANLIFLYRQPRLEVYLPQKYAHIPAQIGYQIFSDETNRNVFLEQAKRIVAEAQAMSHGETSNFPNLSKQELLDLFEKSYVLISKLFKCYRFTELHYFAKLEQIILDCINKNATNQHAQRQILVDLLDTEKKFEHFITSDEISTIRDSIKIIGKEKLVMRSAIVKLGSGFVYEIIKEIAKRLQIEPRILECSTFNEIAEMVRDKSKRSRGLTLARRRGEKFVAITTKDGCTFLSHKESDQILNRFHNSRVGGQQVKGDVASPGTHTANAVLLNVGIGNENTNILNDKIKQMKNGQVVVAATTGPEMMAGLIKAGAIVANEGGIISHAAVISRELKIPCLVNTRCATDIIQDGDLVRVDAYKGIATVINKQQTGASGP